MENKVKKDIESPFRPFVKISLYDCFSMVVLILIVLIGAVKNNLPWYADNALAYLLFFVALFRRRSTRGEETTIKTIALCALIPNIVFSLLTVVWMFLDIAGYSQISRPVSLFLQYASYIALFCALAFDKSDIGVKKLFYALTIVYFSSFFMGILSEGIGSYVVYLTESENTGIEVYYELHDICLTMPLFAVYFAFSQNCSFLKNKNLLLALLVTILGYKRIALFGLLIVFVVGKVLEHRKTQPKLFFVQLAMFLFGIIWVVVCGSGAFADLASKFGINTMGRNNLYGYFDEYISFNEILFSGEGQDFCGVFLVGNPWITVAAIHNDFLRLFIEAGNFWYLTGLLYFVFFIPFVLKIKIGWPTKTPYVICMLYAFIVYSTDNATMYLLFQTSLWLVIFALISVFDSKEGATLERTTQRIGN